MAWSTSSARSKTWSTEILTSADLHTQLDLLHSWNNDSMNGTTGHGHTGGTNDGKPIALASAVSGTLPVTNGGTGQATLAAFLNLIYPVGSLYFNDEVSTNPGTLLGFGTWTAITEKFIIGVGSDTDFDAAKETGGAKTHTHTYSGNTDGVTSGGATGANFAGALDTKHYHAYSGTTASGSSLPPYYAAYIWRRSA